MSQTKDLQSRDLMIHFMQMMREQAVLYRDLMHDKDNMAPEPLAFFDRTLASLTKEVDEAQHLFNEDGKLFHLDLRFPQIHLLFTSIRSFAEGAGVVDKDQAREQFIEQMLEKLEH